MKLEINVPPPLIFDGPCPLAQISRVNYVLMVTVRKCTFIFKWVICSFVCNPRWSVYCAVRTQITRFVFKGFINYPVNRG
jgi:hypothetical protein